MLGESAESKDKVLPVIEATRPTTYLQCPHCQQEIYEKHNYVDDKGVDRHSDCGGAIQFPPPSPEEQAWLKKLLGS